MDSLFNYTMGSSSRVQLVLGFSRKCNGRRLFLRSTWLLMEVMERVKPKCRPALQSLGGRDAWETVLEAHMFEMFDFREYTMSY